jgi:hypothetical protein
LVAEGGISLGVRSIVGVSVTVTVNTSGLGVADGLASQFRHGVDVAVTWTFSSGVRVGSAKVGPGVASLIRLVGVKLDSSRA